MLQQDFFNSEINPTVRSLREKFIIEPFSILNANKWVKRKKQWVDLGIKSELGRDNNLTYGNYKCRF